MDHHTDEEMRAHTLSCGLFSFRRHWQKCSKSSSPPSNPHRREESHACAGSDDHSQQSHKDTQRQGRSSLLGVLYPKRKFHTAIPPPTNSSKIDAPTLGQLPPELLIHINHYLRYRDAVALKRTCRYFFGVVDPGPKPNPPRVDTPRSSEPAVYRIAIVGWMAEGVLHSVRISLDLQVITVPMVDDAANPSFFGQLLRGSEVLDMYNPTLDWDDYCKPLVVDNQDVLLSFCAPPPPQPEYRGIFWRIAYSATGVIVAYNTLQRTTFDEAVSCCSDLLPAFRSEKVEVPILLLGVTIGDAVIGPHQVPEEEASRAAHSLGVDWCPVRIKLRDDLEGVQSSIDEPFIHITRMIQRAVEDYGFVKKREGRFAWAHRFTRGMDGFR